MYQSDAIVLNRCCVNSYSKLQLFCFKNPWLNAKITLGIKYILQLINKSAVYFFPLYFIDQFKFDISLNKTFGNIIADLGKVASTSIVAKFTPNVDIFNAKFILKCCKFNYFFLKMSQITCTK